MELSTAPTIYKSEMNKNRQSISWIKPSISNCEQSLEMDLEKNASISARQIPINPNRRYYLVRRPSFNSFKGL